MAEAILIVNTDGPTVAIPAADTLLISGNLKPTQYNNVRIASDVQFTMTGTSVSQLITLKLKITNPATGTTSTITSWSFRPVTATAAIVNQKLEFITDDRIPTGTSVATGGLLSITVVGAGADANTSAVALNLYVTSVD